MQPLYSVDHETRHNSNHVEDERELPHITSSNNTLRATENTPLVQRFLPEERPRSLFTTLTVSLLLLILVAGVFIGIYLLALQDDSENVLPPVQLPLQLVSRSQWDHSNMSQADLMLAPYRLSNQVLVVHTNTDKCWTTETCTKLLQEMKANATAANSTLPYNFLISSNGQTYEALGWRKSSPMSIQLSSSDLVLAFIGNFSLIPPTPLQIQEARTFFAESVSRQHLHRSYRIIGKNSSDTPAYLSESFKEFPQWND